MIFIASHDRKIPESYAFELYGARYYFACSIHVQADAEQITKTDNSSQTNAKFK